MKRHEDILKSLESKEEGRAFMLNHQKSLENLKILINKTNPMEIIQQSSEEINNLLSDSKKWINEINVDSEFNAAIIPKLKSLVKIVETRLSKALNTSLITKFIVQKAIEQDYTQATLARKADISLSYINRIFKNTRCSISIDYFKRLCEALELDMKEVIVL